MSSRYKECSAVYMYIATDWTVPIGLPRHYAYSTSILFFFLVLEKAKRSKKSKHTSKYKTVTWLVTTNSPRRSELWVFNGAPTAGSGKKLNRDRQGEEKKQIKTGFRVIAKNPAIDPCAQWMDSFVPPPPPKPRPAPPIYSGREQSK